MSQSRNGALRRSSRFSGEAAVPVLPDLGGGDQERTELHTAERWRQERLRNVAIR